MANKCVFVKIAAMDIPDYIDNLMLTATGITQVLETQGGFLILYTL